MVDDSHDGFTPFHLPPQDPNLPTLIVTALPAKMVFLVSFKVGVPAGVLTPFTWIWQPRVVCTDITLANTIAFSMEPEGIHNQYTRISELVMPYDWNSYVATLTDSIRARALAKLTPEERAVLGVHIESPIARIGAKDPNPQRTLNPAPHYSESPPILNPNK